MSKQRYISVSFWDDEWIQTLDPSEKLLYLYLMTNPLTNIAGVYKITNRRICFDTGFNLDTVTHILRKFEELKKVYRHGEFVILPSWPKHQRWEISAKIKDGIISQLQEIPQEVFKRLYEVDYDFELDLVENTIIARKQRRGISGTKQRVVFEKYNNSCALCGVKEDLVIHHIIPIKDGGDNSVKNLQPVCISCHKKIHSQKKTNNVHIPYREVHNYSDFDFDLDTDSDYKAHNNQSSKNEPEKKKFTPANSAALLNLSKILNTKYNSTQIHNSSAQDILAKLLDKFGVDALVFILDGLSAMDPRQYNNPRFVTKFIEYRKQTIEKIKAGEADISGLDKYDADFSKMFKEAANARTNPDDLPI